VNQNLSFDGLGRVTSSSQTIEYQGTWTFPQYQYNLADELTSMTMPTGRVVSTTYDNAGRAVTLQGALGGTTTYASSIGYAPHGAITAMRFGNGLGESFSFNSRLQTTAANLAVTTSNANISRCPG
jgi:YD repeat-containing protein